MLAFISCYNRFSDNSASQKNDIYGRECANKTRNVLHLSVSTLCLAAGTLLISSEAHAQVSDGESGLAMGEIVVTAQRRSERLQDVPISISALTADQLAKTRVTTTQDLQFLAPSLVFAQVAGAAKPYLRGVGSDLAAPNTDSSVAFYQDGVYIANPSALLTNLLGVERVEVLAGPQGTLYGRNALAGAINMITVTPTNEFEAKGSISLGNYDRREVTAQISGGLTDNLSVGIYSAASERDSYIKHPAIEPSSGFNGREKFWGIRGKFVWEASDSFKVTGSLQHSYQNSDEFTSLRNEEPAGAGYALGNSPIFEKYVVPASYIDGLNPNSAIIKDTSVMLRTDTDLGFANLVSIGSYRDFSADKGTDIDGGELNVIRSAAHLPDQSYSGEIQLLSARTSPVKWVIGAYYFHERAGYDPNISFSDVLFPDPIKGSVQFGLIRTRNFAFFGEASVPLTGRVNITAGARYNIENKRFFGAKSYSIDGSGDIVGDVKTFPEFSETFKSFTPKITLSYKNDATLAYATFSKGFKSGVFNLLTPTAPGPVPPEKLTNYEIGLKTELFDKAVRLNTAAYYYDRRNLQTDGQTVVNGVQIVSFQAAGHVEQYGIETSLNASLTNSLRLNASLAWEHSRFKEFDGYVGVIPPTNARIILDVAGNEPAKAPHWVGNVGFDYVTYIGSGGHIDAAINLYYNDGF